MLSIIEKIKNLCSWCCSTIKKEEPKPQQQEPKAKEKPKEPQQSQGPEDASSD